MSYKVGIVEAIGELKDRTGSSMIALKKLMMSKLPKDKKWQNATFLASLKSGVASGDFVQIKSSYKLSADYKKKAIAAAKPKKVAAPKKAVLKKKTAPKKKTTAPKKKTTAPKKKATATAKKPAAKKVTAKKPAAKKVTAKKPAAKKATKKKPAAKAAAAAPAAKTE
jgi:histone H1/5